MANVLTSLISSVYPTDIDDVDPNWIPDIDCQYNIYWQSEGRVYSETFTVFEYDDESRVFAKACEFAKTHDTLVFYREPDFTYFNPNTGEEIHTPHLGTGVDYYSTQEMIYKRIFTAIETDDLPF